MNDTMTVKDQAIDFFVNQGKNKSEINNGRSENNYS